MSAEGFNYIEEKNKKKSKEKKSCLLVEEIQKKFAADIKRRQYVKK